MLRFQSLTVLDRSTGLTIWGTAESAVTIMAASIPVLRVLFRDLKSSTSRRYYGTNESDGTKNSRSSRSQNSTVTISAHPTRPGNRERQVGAYEVPVPAVPSGIVRTNVVQVEFHDKDRKDSASTSSV